jgi:hypothetical protein
MDAERRRRERFKKTVIAFVIGCVLLLVGLLIEGCVSERASGGHLVAPAAERPMFLAGIQRDIAMECSCGVSSSLPTVSNLNVITATEA